MKKRRKSLKPAFPFYGPEHSCKGKAGFATRDLAEKSVAQNQEEFKRDWLNAYRCLWCEKWHVGTRKNAVRMTTVVL